MPQYTGVFLQALLAALLLTPLTGLLARTVGAMDRPSDRSVHTHPVPCLGGIAIYLSFAAPTLVAGLWSVAVVRGLLLGGLLIVVVGVVDDLWGMTAVAKLIGQVAAAAVLVGFGTQISWIGNPFGGIISLGILSVPLTIVWIVAFTNVLNLVDGLDGLAAGIAGIAAISLTVVALRTGQPWLGALLAAALAGSTLGFLPYNFNPARIFMGDAGSLFLGLALAAISVEGMLKSTAALAVGIPLFVLGVPIFDTGFAILRRLRKGVPVHSADGDHLHHRLIKRGLSHRQAVLAMYGVTAWLGLGALAIAQIAVSHAVMVMLFSGLALYAGARRAGVLSMNIKDSRDARR